MPAANLQRDYPDQLPFAQLLEQINFTHCQGLDVGDH